MIAAKICPQCGTEYELDQRFCPKDGTTLRLQNESGDLVGAIIADRYHVLAKLGEGGMGQVYLAEHVKMGRKSALKVMNPSMVKDADAISRFNREASNASRINHPNVADVYDFGETPDGVIYLAMEFVDGPPLTKLIETEGPLPLARAASIARQAAEALAVAHDMGIVHRDLKPDNIMIARNRDGSDCVKVVDFGIAKAADNASQKVTKTGLVVGTPEYMSPEQLAGDKLDGRSDIYALGLVTFNMLTGALPFPAETAQESMILRLTERPRRLVEMKPDVAWSDEVQAVLDRALERDAARRYQSAAEFGRALTTSVRNASPVYRDSGLGERPADAEGNGSPKGARVSATRSMPAPAGPGVSAASAASGGGANGGASAAPVPATRVGARDSAADRNAGGAASLPAPTAAGGAARGGRGVMIGVGTAVLITLLGGGAIYLSSRGRAAPNEHAPAAEVAAAPAAAPNVDSALASIDSLKVLESGDSAQAKRAIHSLDALSGRQLTAAQRVHLTLIRVDAMATLGDTLRICQLMRSVRESAIGTPYADRVASFLRLNDCKRSAS